MGMTPVIVYSAVAGLAGYFNPIAPPGAEGYDATPRHHFRGIFQNDSISGYDRNFSHGTRLDYAQDLKSGDAWGISIMQNIYTPEAHASGDIPGQHPYCGYAALGAAYLARGENWGCATELQLGVTGNASLAERTQNAVHEMLHMEKWYGWNDQIQSEVTVQLTSRQDFRIRALEGELAHGWETDGVFQVKESVGTFDMSGWVGLVFRVGRNLPPSMSTPDDGAGNFGINVIKKPSYQRDKLSYFMLASVTGGYVARDLTIDGGVFHHFEQTCSRTPWQTQAQLGVGVSYHGIDYYAGLLYMSRTYRTQEHNSLMGVFSLSWHW